MIDEHIDDDRIRSTGRVECGVWRCDFDSMKIQMLLTNRVNRSPLLLLIPF
jgi:hypothetical protein